MKTILYTPNDIEEVGIKCCQPFIVENSSYIPEIITISKNSDELTVTSSWENYDNYEGEIEQFFYIGSIR